MSLFEYKRVNYFPGLFKYEPLKSSPNHPRLTVGTCPQCGKLVLLKPFMEWAWQAKRGAGFHLLHSAAAFIKKIIKEFL